MKARVSFGSAAGRSASPFTPAGRDELEWLWFLVAEYPDWQTARIVARPVGGTVGVPALTTRRHAGFQTSGPLERAQIVALLRQTGCRLYDGDG